MATQEVCGRSQCVSLGSQIDAAAAVAIDGKTRHIGGQELGPTDFTMCRTLEIGESQPFWISCIKA